MLRSTVYFQQFVFIAMVSLAIFLFPQLTMAETYYEYKDSKLLNIYSKDNGKFYKATFIHDKNGNIIGKKMVPANAIDYPAETSYSNASYDIVLFNVDPKATQVEFPTWTENNGQDDVIWHQGEKVGDGIWKVTIPFSKHKDESGKYITHIYVDKTMWAASETTVKLTTSTRVPPTVNLSSGSYDIYLDGVGEHVARVAFPTWTLHNGQDDIVWNEGEKVSPGTWKITIPFSEHNQEIGEYITHIYSYDRRGNAVMSGFGQTTAVGGISAPAETSYSNASFDIIAYGIDPKATQVEFPTWTAKDGKDVIWYQGEKIGNGAWKVTIPFSKHKDESGKYITHIYVDKTMWAASETMVNLTTSTRIPPTVNLSSGSYDVYIDGVGEQITRVSFPTWTQRNGQDDIVWKEGYKVGTNTWKITVPFSEHNQETGEYITHIYSYDRHGNAVMSGFGQTTVVGGISAPAETSYSNASFDITAYGIDPKATQVEFPTWTEKDGRDVIWYQGEKVGNGVWKVTIPFSKHKDEGGKYITHIYVDKTIWAASETMVNLTTSTRIPPTVNLSSGSYDIYLDGVGGHVARVAFPTWTQLNGQDDIVWKDGYKVGANTWKITIPFSEHNQETGEYITHIYSYDRQGNAVMSGFGQTTVVGGISASAETSYSNASFDITAYGIDPKATQVEFPTWTEKNGQDDVIWYQGEKVGNGIWKITIPFSKHKDESGKYITHIYVDKTMWAASETMVNLTTNTRNPSTVNLSSGSYDIYIDGVGEQVTRVAFPTWTQRNGQDDIVWKDGFKVGANTWKITVPFSEHNQETGQYITHIYSYDQKGNAVMIGYGSVLVN